jgi:hypothetical protein
LEDDADAIAAAVRKAFSTPVASTAPAPAPAPAPVSASAPAPARSMQVERFLEMLRSIDPNQPLDGESLRKLWQPRLRP